MHSFSFSWMQRVTTSMVYCIWFVQIYPSEFGKERIQTEQTQGPLELMALPEDPEKDTDEEK